MTRPFQERIPSKIGMWLYQLRLYWHNFLLTKIPHEKSSHKGETLQIPLVVIVLLRMHKHVRSYLHAQNVTMPIQMHLTKDITKILNRGKKPLTNVTTVNIPVHIPGVLRCLWELNGTQNMFDTCGPGVPIRLLAVVLSPTHTPDWGMMNY